MPKILIRIVAVLMLACHGADPSLACAPKIPVVPMRERAIECRLRRPIFDSQALANVSAVPGGSGAISHGPSIRVVQQTPEPTGQTPLPATAPGVSDAPSTTPDSSPLVLFNHTLSPDDIQQAAVALQSLEPFVAAVVALLSEIIAPLSAGQVISHELPQRLEDLVSDEYIATISKGQGAAFLHLVRNSFGPLMVALEVPFLEAMASSDARFTEDRNIVLESLSLVRDNVRKGLEIFRLAARRAA